MSLDERGKEANVDGGGIDAEMSSVYREAVTLTCSLSVQLQGFVANFLAYSAMPVDKLDQVAMSWAMGFSL